MSVIYILAPGFKDTDEYYWWAITNPDGTPRPSYTCDQSMAGGRQLAKL